MDLRQFKSAPDQLVLVGIGLLALIYVGTGPKAWAEERWATAAGAAAGAIGMLKSGQLIGRKEGWDEGYNTLNPKLHVADIIAYTGPAAEPEPAPEPAPELDAWDRLAATKDWLGDWYSTSDPQQPDPDPRGALGSEPQQPASRVESLGFPIQQPAPHPSPLPRGWWIDDRGRFRDRSNRIASDERRLSTLAAEAQS